jgi:hypothetical protein
VTTPTTTDTNTNKINPSSATDLTSPAPVVGIRNDGQQEFGSGGNTGNGDSQDGSVRRIRRIAWVRPDIRRHHMMDATLEMAYREVSEALVEQIVMNRLLQQQVKQQATELEQLRSAQPGSASSAELAESGERPGRAGRRRGRPARADPADPAR